MKKNVMRMLGALAMTAAVAMVFGACSSEDNMVADNGATDGSTAVRGVMVTVSAGIGDNTDPTPAPPLDGRGVAGAVTRSAVVTGTDAETGKTTRTLKFTTGDRLHVYHKKDSKNYKAGILTMVGEPTNDGKNATFSGEITGYTKPPKGNYYEVNGYYDFGADPLVDTKATLIHKDAVERTTYDIRDGDIILRAPTATDVATVMTTCLEVSGNYVSGKGYTLTGANALFDCTFTGLVAETEYDFRMYYFDGANYYSHAYGDITTDENGTGTVAFKHKIKDEYQWVITISNSDLNFEATIDLGTRAFEAGKIYNVSRHWNGTSFVKSVYLPNVTSDITVPDGYTLTGELKSKVKISIPNGATVTLAGVTINGMTLNSENSWDYNWAGLTCLGYANIVLNGENTVTSFYSEYPGIQVGPDDTTLTISGSGKLTANGGDKGAGIGSRAWYTCGAITISGGTVEAYSELGAGIGSGKEGKCGDITINGGTVTASSNVGACIGSGQQGTCGAITITSCTVTATNNETGAAIGCGEDGYCGDITIDKGNEDYINVKAEINFEAKPIGLSKNGYCGTITIGGYVLYDPDVSDSDYKIYSLNDYDDFRLNLNESNDQVWYVKSFRD